MCGHFAQCPCCTSINVVVCRVPKDGQHLQKSGLANSCLAFDDHWNARPPSFVNVHHLSWQKQKLLGMNNRQVAKGYILALTRQTITCKIMNVSPLEQQTPTLTHRRMHTFSDDQSCITINSLNSSIADLEQVVRCKHILPGVDVFQLFARLPSFTGDSKHSSQHLVQGFALIQFPIGWLRAE